MNEDGTFNGSPSGTLPNIQSVSQNVIPTEGVGAVYELRIHVPTGTPTDGEYYLSTADNTANFVDDAKKAMFTMDTRKPVVENLGTRTIGQNYANINGEWETHFEIAFDLKEGKEDDADDTEFVSGLVLSSIMFETDPEGELTFSSVRTDADKYVVTATPVVTAAAKPAVSVNVTIKVADMAGNIGMNASPLEVKLAMREGTGVPVTQPVTEGDTMGRPNS